MRIDLNRFVPLGMEGNKEGQWILTGWIVSACGAVLNFSNQYTDALSRLYVHGWGSRRLIDGAVMTPFSRLMQGCEVGFMLMGVAMAMLGVYHYFYHSQGSKSIYLMWRLPRREELHIRCLAMPVAGALGGLALLGLLTVLFFVIYNTCTPAQCLLRR